MQTAQEIERVYAREDVRPEKTPIRTKFNISMEKKIEKLWLESTQQGWDYCKFVAVVMEVLTVLHHRKKLQHCVRPPQKVVRRKRALS